MQNEAWKDYKKHMIGRLEPCSEGTILVLTCILCDSNDNLIIQAFYVNDEKKQVVAYNLCDTCFKELESCSEENRRSIIEKVIEKKIDQTMAMPHLKMKRRKSHA